jgi:tripartite ATP-independent transporter DctM subunit
MLGYVMVVALVCYFKPDLAPAAPKMPWSGRLKALLAVWPIMTIFVAVFGGIYAGVFSPTEGAAVGAVLTLAAAVMNREMSWRALWKSCTATAETSAMVFLIFLGADMMNAALALTAMPSGVAGWITSLHASPLLIVGCILAMYVVLGCVMDELSMLLLTIPVIFPAVMGLDLYGLNPEMKAIWFGILVLMTVGIGMLAPPVGLNVYVVNNLAKDVSMNETYKGVFPFLAWDAIRLTLLLSFPVISLGLVTVLFAR